MSDITIKNEENQDKNQKTTPVVGSLSELNISRKLLPGDILQIWLGWRDSNPRMPGPKPGALPLGHIPSNACVHYYSKAGEIRKQNRQASR